LERTLAIDETWVSLYSPPPHDKQRFWLKASEPAPEVPASELRERKRMLILAMDIKGIAFWHLCEEGETVTSETYRNFLETYIPNWMRGKKFKGPILLHDNARPHKSRLISDYLEENSIETWGHPAYSPDVMPPDFNCFGSLKHRLKGKRYQNWNQFKDVLQSAIDEDSRRGLFKGVSMLQERWQKVVELEVYYI
jgi:hypothetical protein